MTAIVDGAPSVVPSHRLVARQLDPSRVASLVAPFAPDELLSRAAAVWERGSENTRLLGFGEALRLRGERDSTLADAIRQVRAVQSSVRANRDDVARPRFFGGARFRPGGRVVFDGWQPFGGWQFVLPRLLLVQARDGMHATVLATESEFSERGPEAIAAAAIDHEMPPVRHGLGRRPDSDIEHWAGRVATAIEQIRAGSYEKVVLAVHRDIEVPESIDQGALLAALADRYPDCYTFKFVAGGATWLGASPELLAGHQSGVVRAASLAGSRPRGGTVAADDVLARELLASPKEREEHRLVVEALAGSLRSVCSGVSVPPEPQIMRMANIQHLHTPLTASMQSGRDILDLVAAVHPTPAVGGSPREAAIDAIEALEGIDRGWYAAPIGWFDLEGNGEFAVALRSGLIRGNRADLFAGCGIVAGSVPAAEVAEVQQKLRALGDAIQAIQA